MGWQRNLNSFALSYTHVVAGGGGLVSAVQLDSATASFRQRIGRMLTVSATGGYAQNNTRGAEVGIANDGHSISGAISLQQQVGEHLELQLGYTRLYQKYSNVQAISANPNTNREFIAISYLFSRPLGR